MKTCKHCEGAGKIINLGKNFETSDPSQERLKLIACPYCDGTGELLAKGEVGWGNLNDFGQEGEDITNL